MSAARRSGETAGLREGRIQGQQQGYQQGQQAGYSQGQVAGQASGYQQGQQQGFNQGQSSGYSQGFNSGSAPARTSSADLMQSSEAALAVPAPDWDSELLYALYQLVFSSPDREVAGVLVGSPADQSETGLPVVRAAIPATQSFVPGEASMFAYMTWAHVHEAMARVLRGLETVGWYVEPTGTRNGSDPAGCGPTPRAMVAGRQGQILYNSVVGRRAALYGYGPGGLVPLTEGPVARRYTHPAKPRLPLAATGVLAVAGATCGALVFLIAQALGG